MNRGILRNIHDLDEACRAYFLKADINLTAVALWAVVLLIPPMNYLDYRYYGFSNDYFTAALLEGSFGALTLLVLISTRRNKNLSTYENWMFAWCMFVALTTLLVDTVQPARIIENSIFYLMFLLAIYLIIPNRLVFRLLPAGITTLACAGLLLTTRQISFENKYMLIGSMLAVNLGGLFMIAYNNDFKHLLFQAQNSERDARRQFEMLANIDSLTGIFNRRSFIEQAQAEFLRFGRFHSPLCLVMMDLDLFKAVNDAHGHLVGDEALKKFVSAVLDSKRTYDTFGRIGGEEFCLLLPETCRADALIVVARIRLAVKEMTIPSGNGGFSLTFSAGVTEARQDDKSLDDLLRRADEALYRGKDLGRDRIETAI